MSRELFQELRTLLMERLDLARDLSDEEILAYIQTGECLDKAGSYGIQGYGGRYITHIDGDYYAIMGLPLHIVYEELKHIGLY